MIFIDLKDSRPIYEQVAERFKFLILKGVIASDEKLPSVRNLAVDLSINPNTIQRAYAELERQGYIYTVKGKGNFAAGNDQLIEQYREEIRKQIKGICETAVSVGMTEEELIRNIREWRSL
ncbi:MAG: GntR family transcriptional regulator [Lachnospiraceae bacterium]|nr:GntR family transcriptional regulator [Lachnospiraceae bacterium]MBD5454999.1 GntR family transcriptional regulator [Lachnospiraceae bacterium]